MTNSLTHNKKEKALGPYLRFRGFVNSLDILKLGELAIFKSGGTPPKDNPKYWGGVIPWISAASMSGKYYAKSERTITEEGLKNGSKLAPKGSLLLLVRGSMLFNKIPIGIAEIDVAFNQDLKALSTNENTTTDFLYQWFYSKQNLLLDKVVGTGIGAGKLDTDDLKSLNVYLPTLPEQQKIAAFLSAVDEKIQQLSRKKELLEQYKKGVMQQLFSGKLRFKDENGKAFPKWEEKSLGDVLDYIQPTKYLVASTEYDDSYSTPVLTAGKTFILGYTNETNDVFNKNLPVILFDDFTTATQFVDFPFKAKSSAMKILVAKKAENISYIHEAMRLIKFEIGGHGRHWISQFALFNIPYPCIDEQKKIANFLSNIDEKIEIVNKQITQTQTFKKGLLQQMFV